MRKLFADIQRKGRVSLALLALVSVSVFSALIFVTAQDGGSQQGGSISTADLKLGDPLSLTTNGEYDVALSQPSWLLAVMNLSGQWQTNPPTSWYVPLETSNDTGNLSFLLDWTILTNNSVGLSLTYFDTPASSLYLDLLDTNATVIATNFSGNLLSGSAVMLTTNIILPLAAYPEAAILDLRRGTGEIAVYEAQLFADLSGTITFSATNFPTRLTVGNGTGSGWYIPGSSAAISANPAATGCFFDRWVVNSGSPAIANTFAPDTTLTMPAGAAAVSAAYNGGLNSADITITCDDMYQLYVNGVLVGSGNSLPLAQRYVGLGLLSGANVIAVKGTDGGGAAALLAEVVGIRDRPSIGIDDFSYLS